MLLVDRSYYLPQENLACDDELLAGEREALRVWESPVPFVVLGRSGKGEAEVHLGAAAAAGIPVLRRSSGGGTVLQGPGCLNYALVLSLSQRPELEDVERSYELILGAVASALAVPGLEVAGSDLLLAGRKVSGSAQRRTRGWLLHHGTLLYEVDLEAVERLLPEPARRPAHREGRTHREFLGTLPVPREELRQRLFAIWPDGGRQREGC